MILLYHRTNQQSAERILRKGFRNGTGTYMTTKAHSGVWLSEKPLDENEGAFGDTLLEVAIDMNESEIDQYEWKEEGKPYREFLVPAAELNARSKVRVVADESEWKIIGMR